MSGEVEQFGIIKVISLLDMLGLMIWELIIMQNFVLCVMSILCVKRWGFVI